MVLKQRLNAKNLLDTDFLSRFRNILTGQQTCRLTSCNGRSGARRESLTETPFGSLYGRCNPLWSAKMPELTIEI